MKHILPLEIRSIAPAEHLNTDIVLACAYMGTDIELMVVIAALCISDILAINPNECSTVETVEVKEDVLCIPAFRQGECAAVRTHRVIAHTFDLVGNIRWIVVECILHVNIERKVARSIFIGVCSPLKTMQCSL